MKCFITSTRGALALMPLISLNALAASDLSKQWDVALGGTSYEECTAVLATSDGGCVVAGGSFSGTDGNKTSANLGAADYWFLKLNANGNKVWEHTYGGNTNEYPNGVQATPDGGYLLAGWSASPPSGNKTLTNAGDEDYWLVKTDGSGNKLWERVFGGTGWDRCWFMGVSSNTYLLGGGSDSGADGNKNSGNFGHDDGWVVNVDTNGNKLWEGDYGGNWYDYIYDVKPTADGGYILVGESDSDPATGNKQSPWYGYYDGWVVKIDGSGNKQWDVSYGGTNDDWFETCVVLSNGYLVGGSSWSGASGNKTTGVFGDSPDWWLLKLNSSGNKVWEKTYGGTDWDFLKFILPTDDGGFLLLGTSYSGISGNKTTANFGDADYWLIKIDADGNKLWEMEFGGSDRDLAVNTLRKTSDGGYVLGGYSKSTASGNKSAFNNGNFDYWIVKLMPPIMPTLMIEPAGAGQVSVSWAPTTSNVVLQQTSDLTVSNGWSNTSTGMDNPALLPTTMPATFFRLSSP